MKSQIVFIFLTLCGASLCQGQGCENVIGDASCNAYKSLGYCTYEGVENLCYKTCNPVECDDTPCLNLPTISSNGYNEPNSTFYFAGPPVAYVCNAGYILEGPDTNTCLLNDTWTNGAPTCVPACPPLPVDSALYIPSSGPYREGDIVEYRCVNQTAAVVGNPFSTCVENNTVLSWSLETLPTCDTSGFCGPPPMIAVDGLNPESRDYASGSVATYQCRERRVLEGSSSTSCINGSWTEPAPICYQDCVDFQDCTNNVNFNYCTHPIYLSQMEELCRKSCGLCSNCTSPPTGDDVIAAPSGPFMQGSRVNYTCANGTLFGADSNLCLPDDVWLNESPVCYADCPDLPTIANGGNLPNGTTHSHGTTVQYSCDDGYMLFPPTENTCNDGNWSESSAGECRKICEAFPQLHEHLVATTSPPFYLAGDSLNFTCSNGTLEGSATVTCSASGTWSTFPTCRADCHNLPTIANGDNLPNGTTHSHGTTVQYSCDTGYMLFPPTENTCNDGNWSESSAGECRKICEALPQLHEHLVATTSPPFYLAGDSLNFTCSNGTLEGSATVTCSASGNWSTFPTCRADCENLPTVIANGGQSQNETTASHGTIVHYFCDEGYQIISPPFNLCNDGNWTEIFPATCVKICDTIPVLDELLVAIGNDSVLIQGQTVGFVCKNGTLDGPSTLTCSANGTWEYEGSGMGSGFMGSGMGSGSGSGMGSDDVFPTCIAECGPPPIDGSLILTNVVLPEFVEGAMVEYGCRMGVTSDPTTSVCQSNAEWSLTDLPMCFP